MDKKIESKFLKLKDILARMGKVLIAFSGGSDSTFLLKAASLVLADDVLAVTADSHTYPAEELKQAKILAKEMKVKLIVIRTHELRNQKFKSNPANRCYYCKRELFETLRRIARKYNIKYILDGSNVDDKYDFRPGSKAKNEFKVRSPLFEAGLGKKEIRELSKKLALKTWDKPALACLASRVPYGVAIKIRDLLRVDRAEQFLRSLGFRQVRLRHYGRLARIEVERPEITRLISPQVRDKIIDRLKKLGYNYVTVDLAGYRTGSLNPVRNSKAT